MVFYHKQGPANHYTCAVRRNSKWFHCNDGYVKEFNPTVIDVTAQPWIPVTQPQIAYSVNARSFHHRLSEIESANQSDSAPSDTNESVLSHTLSEIAYFFCRDRKGSTPSVDSILMQNDTSNESPVVVGKGKTVSKVPPEAEMELESRKSEGDSSPLTMEPATPMGCLKTRSTPALIGA